MRSRGTGPGPVPDQRRHLLVRVPATSTGHPLIEAGKGPAIVGAIRVALAAGDVREAERLVQRLQHGHSQAYQPLVDLWLESEDVDPDLAAGYRSSLDLRTAVAEHSWDTAGGRTSTRTWVSAPDQALVVHRRTETSTARIEAVHPDGNHTPPLPTLLPTCSPSRPAQPGRASAGWTTMRVSHRRGAYTIVHSTEGGGW